MGAKSDLTSGTASVSVYQGKREPEEIRAEMEQTRANLSETINNIQERLSPENIKEQAQDVAVQLKDRAQDMVRDATIGRIEKMTDNVNRKARGMGQTLMDTARQNPVPAALIGLGLGWLLVESWNNTPERRYSQWREEYPTGGQYRYYEPGDRYRSQSMVRQTFGEAQEKVSEVAGQAQEKVTELGSQAQEKVQQLGHQVQDTAQRAVEQVGEMGSQAREQVMYLGDQAQEQMRRAKGQFWDLMESNPLMVGAGALALGVVVGLSIPETRYEHRLMGETRDNLLDKAQEAGQETMQKVERVAEQAKETIKEEAKNQELISSSDKPVQI